MNMPGRLSIVSIGFAGKVLLMMLIFSSLFVFPANLLSYPRTPAS